MSRTILHSLGVLFLGMAIASSGWAQGTLQAPLKTKANAAPVEAPKPAGPPGAKKPQAVRITEEVRPAFVIEPIVHRVEGRRGKVLNVEFAITCQGAPSVVEIRPVALTQDENGTIFPNEKVPAPEDLEVMTPGTVELKAEEKFLIKARLRVPDTQTTFHTFGILVRDTGQLRAKVNEALPDGPRVGIKFVTQYLLRCDVSVQGVRAEGPGKLLVEAGELDEVDGVPLVRVFVHNPTDGPIEFGLRAQVRSSQESDDKPTFPLGMPVRANLDEPEKYFGRILPGAKIRLEGKLPKPIFPGQFYLEAALVWDNRVFSETGFPVVVTEGEFPAQGIASVLAAPGLLASPSQIELSLQRGGNRAEILVLENEGTTATEVEVLPETLEGQPIDWVGVRPNKVSLAPGTTRKVSVTLSASGDPNSHRYAQLRIKSTPTGGAVEQSTPIVVALLGRSTTQAVLEAGEPVWDTEHGTPAFVVEVKNTGARHMPLEGQLVLGDESGRPIEVRGGFGKWVLPGATERVRFNPPQSMAQGKYTARMRLYTGENSEPIEKRLEFNLTSDQP